MKFKEKINTWIFDLDNTLYSADSGIFQQVHRLMGEFISNNLNMEISDINLSTNHLWMFFLLFVHLLFSQLQHNKD